MRIGLRLLTNSVFIASFSVIITALLIGAVSYSYGKGILEQDAEDRLALVRDLKVDSLTRYFAELKNQAVLFSHNATIINAMSEFDAAFNKYAAEVSSKGMDKYKDQVIKSYLDNFSQDYAAHNGGIPFDATPFLNLSNESTFALQYNYIFRNPYGIDKESKLETVDDGSTYSKVHKKFHAHIREFKELSNLEDIFLVDAKTGDIVYSVAKGLDFTTSLTNGPYANSALADLFRKDIEIDSQDTSLISNFDAYSPSNDDQAAFVATGIYKGDEKIGVLIFQISLNTINDIMTSSNKWEDVGLGKTGESYIVDDKHRMMTMSRFFVQDPKTYLTQMKKTDIDQDDLARMQAKQNNMGLQKINTVSVHNVLNGQTGFAFYKDYRGVEVLGAYEPINISGLNWGVICEIDKAEAFAPVKALAKKIIINLTGIMILILFFAFIVGIGLAKQISNPIEKLSTEILVLSKTQDLTKRIEYAADDEIGDMAKSINNLIESFQNTCKETIMSTQRVQSAAHKLMNLADDIDAQESNHKFEDNFDIVHEKTSAIKDAGDSLEELSVRLQMLSKQFKVFEAESERTSGW